MNYSVLSLPRLSDTSLNYGTKFTPLLRHPLFGWLGLRPALAQHTAEEHAALRRLAAGRSSIAEIGVAEGVSAAAMREVMSADGVLYLIDPFHLSRVPALNFTKRIAHRAVEASRRGQTVWIEKFSFDAARGWNTSIDLLFVDGDHSERGVQRDWDDWSRFVVPGGIVVFHDARLFAGGWTSAAYGPVNLVDSLFRNAKIRGWTIVEEIHSLVAVERNG
ncbi:MAG TPA: class I SAM-dependent methyltransferase [Candidatus Acidoferrales bacterium]|nr:class I SAM-dependent methyltransferase [Candidatus Acidoferrales bacterium]